MCIKKQLEPYVFQVLSDIQFGERLDSLPNGMETSVAAEFDPEGVNFSGGECQKLAMNRSIIWNNEIVILDEPTDAIDSLSGSIA